MGVVKRGQPVTGEKQKQERQDHERTQMNVARIKPLHAAIDEQRQDEPDVKRRTGDNVDKHFRCSFHLGETITSAAAITFRAIGKTGNERTARKLRE